jgi:hypothetical protein
MRLCSWMTNSDVCEKKMLIGISTETRNVASVIANESPTLTVSGLCMEDTATSQPAPQGTSVGELIDAAFKDQFEALSIGCVSEPVSEQRCPHLKSSAILGKLDNSSPELGPQAPLRAY